MSAERRWNARRYHLEESTTLNNNRRTVFIEHMTPNTSVPPHYHTRFTETFDLISGSMILYSSSQPHSSEPDLDALAASSQKLVVGGKHVSMTPGLYHQYVAGDEDTTVRVILTPGHRDFEQLLMVLNGMAEDGELEGLAESVVLMAVIFGLSDAWPIGPTKELLEGVRRDKGGEIEELRGRLLAKYDNEEGLRKLMARDG